MPNGTSLAYMSRAGTRLGFAATTSKTRQFIEGEKSNVSGETLCQDGDLVGLRDKQTPEVVALNILDATQIERKNHEFPLYRHTDMDVAALRPGLTIEAEGIGNSSGQLEASKISFTRRTLLLKQPNNSKFWAIGQPPSRPPARPQLRPVLHRVRADQARDSAEQATLQAEAANVVGLTGFNRDSAVLKDEAKAARSHSRGLQQ
jgi:hypothetical protein